MALILPCIFTFSLFSLKISRVNGDHFALGAVKSVKIAYKRRDLIMFVLPHRVRLLPFHQMAAFSNFLIRSLEFILMNSS